MKNSAIYLALTALFAAACAEGPADEGAPAEAESAPAIDAEASGLDAARASAPIETDAKCVYAVCMQYCTQEHTFAYCHSLCSKCEDGQVF
jgi:hypothetical protein